MPAKGSFGLDAIRGLVLRKSERQSLRELAGEVGISYTGLRFFLKGSRPQPENLRRLVAWYGGARSGSGERVKIEDVQAAITLVARHVQGSATPKLKRKRLERVVEMLSAELEPDGKSLLAAIISELR